jgi:beta-lactam-binding protein with PASTA domain
LRSFSVSAAAQTVPLDRGRGTAAFTVSNVSPVPVRGRLKVEPLPPTPAAWLALDGEAERDFATNQAEQVRVKIAVPDGSAAAEYPFRLHVYSAATPDEDFTEGSVVTFAVAALRPPPPWPRWLLPAAVAAAVLVAVLVTVLVVTAKPPVPDVKGLPVELAEERLKAAGLTGKRTEVVTFGEPGTVLEQKPTSKDGRPRDGVVELTVEYPLVAVPDVQLMTTADAMGELTKRNLLYVPIDFTKTPDRDRGLIGRVAFHYPRPWTDKPTMYVRPGTCVFVAEYADPVAVPQVVGDTLPDAVAKLARAGFQKWRIEDRGPMFIRSGCVSEQVPTADPSTPQSRNTSITLKVKTESVEVPKVTGLTYEAAKAALLERSLNVDPAVTFDPPLTCWRRPATVTDQSISPGTMTGSGGKVRLTVVTEPTTQFTNPAPYLDPAVTEALTKSQVPFR